MFRRSYHDRTPGVNRAQDTDRIVSSGARPDSASVVRELGKSLSG